jgi:hypothetical protein
MRRFLAVVLCDLFFGPNVLSSTFYRNVGEILPEYTAFVLLNTKIRVVITGDGGPTVSEEEGKIPG